MSYSPDDPESTRQEYFRLFLFFGVIVEAECCGVGFAEDEYGNAIGEPVKGSWCWFGHQ